MIRQTHSRRAKWQKVLDMEVARWSAMSWEELATELRDVRAYQVELDSKQYQVEVQMLENTADYVHVSVSVDDGSLAGGSLNRVCAPFIAASSR